MTHVSSWTIRLELCEQDDHSSEALAILDTGANVLRARGRTTAGEGLGVDEIQDEIAAGRALVNLGYQLVGFGAADAEGRHPVQ